MPKKKLKKKTPTWYRKKCVVWAKLEARKRDNDTCQYCGKSKAQGWQIHGSHILPEGTYISMSADPNNIIALCATHHTGGMWKNAKEPSWHTDPMEMSEWFNKKWPGRYQELRKQAQTLQVINWEKRYNEIKLLN